MTRNPLYVTGHTRAIEALQKMVQGPHNLIETLRERMFKPSLSTIITENTKVATVSLSDLVCVATWKMHELRVNSVIVTAGNSLHGIFTSKDVLMRVVAQNLSPELTLVEKVMTAHPDCATLDTTILDALHIMHDGKFLHIPVLDGDGRVAACLDVLQITHAAISMVSLSMAHALHRFIHPSNLSPSEMFFPLKVEGGPGAANDVANTIMQKFWDSALALEPPYEDFDSHSELSLVMPSDARDGRSSIYPPAVDNSFVFKLQDKKGRMHRFTCGSESLDELMSSLIQRLGMGDEKSVIQLLYEDDEGDKVLLTTNSDLTGAVLYAKSSGLKALRLHIDDSDSSNEVTQPLPELVSSSHGSQSMHIHYGLMACAIALTGVAVMVYLRHSKA
ncbi:CBS domain-containing protein CBSCBSPB3-like isoform X3 [Miscanthus floridulus]|uniref:CBS domain-containing protein CBSCBSPB3-like isoform X3 n=1 Tax=Miscanthus floridulus TaxID=154761 RepID=UPI0034581FA8